MPEFLLVGYIAKNVFEIPDEQCKFGLIGSVLWYIEKK